MPSLVGGRDMNSFDYDRGGPARMNGLSTNGGGFDHYRDDYSREDMRRDDDERYRKGARNGGPSFDRFNTDYLDQNSLSDFRSNEPKFELDHLATFAAGTRNGCIHAEDGLRKLRQMENTTGIWTMRCVLIVERSYLVILDNSTGEELERFPIQLVQDPTAIFKNDRREIYNNLILFTIIDDPKKRSSQADMHIFQSCKAPAQEIVDEILAAKGGQQRLYQGGGGSRIPPPPAAPAPEPPSSSSNNVYDFHGMREYFDSRQYNSNATDSRQYNSNVNTSASDMRGFNQFNQQSYSQGGQFGGPIGGQRSLITRINTVKEREDIEGGSTEILERDVQLLNHCFDDIEKFVARLQQAAESYKELEKRKRDRGAKNKKRQSGDGMLNARARPPPDRDFVDIFQKFKLSFNLLAKLKAHIHDPNAPELVHFLFTPLSLIYEASRDPYHGNQNLGDQAVAPVLTADAKQLLLNCLTSKEIELWQALGKNWTTSRDEWHGHIPPYVPEFYDGWQPAAGILDELTARSAVMQPPIIAAAPAPMIEQGRTQALIEERPRPYNPPLRPMAFPDEDRSVVDHFRREEEFERFESTPRGYEPSTSGFESLQTRGFEPVHAPSASRGYEPQPLRGFEPPRGYDAHSHERASPRIGMGSPYSSDFVETHQVERNIRQEIPKPMMERDTFAPSAMSSHDDNNAAYLDELRRMGNVTIYEAAHSRQGKNSKELTVEKGDILQVLDSSKNWWKLRNYKGQVGFAPYTILKAIKTEETFIRNDIPNGIPSSRATMSDNSYLDDRGASRRDPFPEKPPYKQHRREESKGSSVYRPDSPPPTRRSPSPLRYTNMPRRHESSKKPTRQESPRRRSYSPRESPSRGYSRRNRRDSSDERNRSPGRYDRRESPKRDRESPSRRKSSRRQRSWSPSQRRSSPSKYRDSSPSYRRGSPTRRRSQSPSYRRHSPQRGRSPSPPSHRRGGSPARRGGSPPSFRHSSPSKERRNPIPPPPPKPKVKTTTVQERSSRREVEAKGIDRDRPSKGHLHEELQARVTSRQLRPFRQPGEVTRLTKNSSAADVLDWLINKGFSERAKEHFRGYTGFDMFQLHFNELQPILGHEEALRLDGLISLQKNSSGYATRSAKELNDILRKRKQHVMDNDPSEDRDDDSDGDYRKPSSGSSLRDLLVRQKTQLRNSVDFDL